VVEFNSGNKLVLLNNIYLTGFMGVGKSTVGPLLAERCSLDFKDADHFFEIRKGMTVTEFFRTQGEPQFREIEHQLVRELVQGKGRVVALGGGALLTAGTSELLKGTGRLIYLKASVPSLMSRLSLSLENRPLLKEFDSEERENQIQDLLKRRSSFYEDADFTFDTDCKSPEEIVNEIVKRIL